MCVSSILVVGEDCNLDHEGADWLICPLEREKDKTETEKNETNVLSLTTLLSTTDCKNSAQIYTIAHDKPGWGEVLIRHQYY